MMIFMFLSLIASENTSPFLALSKRKQFEMDIPFDSLKNNICQFVDWAQSRKDRLSPKNKEALGKLRMFYVNEIRKCPNNFCVDGCAQPLDDPGKCMNDLCSEKSAFEIPEIVDSFKKDNTTENPEKIVVVTSSSEAERGCDDPQTPVNTIYKQSSVIPPKTVFQDYPNTSVFQDYPSTAVFQEYPQTNKTVYLSALSNQAPCGASDLFPYQAPIISQLFIQTKMKTNRPMHRTFNQPNVGRIRNRIQVTPSNPNPSPIMRNVFRMPSPVTVTRVLTRSIAIPVAQRPLTRVLIKPVTRVVTKKIVVPKVSTVSIISRQIIRARPSVIFVQSPPTTPPARTPPVTRKVLFRIPMTQRSMNAVVYPQSTMVACETCKYPQILTALEKDIMSSTAKTVTVFSTTETRNSPTRTETVTIFRTAETAPTTTIKRITVFKTGSVKDTTVTVDIKTLTSTASKSESNLSVANTKFIVAKNVVEQIQNKSGLMEESSNLTSTTVVTVEPNTITEPCTTSRSVAQENSVNQPSPTDIPPSKPTTVTVTNRITLTVTKPKTTESKPSVRTVTLGPKSDMDRRMKEIEKMLVEDHVASKKMIEKLILALERHTPLQHTASLPSSSISVSSSDVKSQSSTRSRTIEPSPFSEILDLITNSSKASNLVSSATTPSTDQSCEKPVQAHDKLISDLRELLARHSHNNNKNNEPKVAKTVTILTDHNTTHHASINSVHQIVPTTHKAQPNTVTVTHNRTVTVERHIAANTTTHKNPEQEVQHVSLVMEKITEKPCSTMYPDYKIVELAEQNKVLKKQIRSAELTLENVGDGKSITVELPIDKLNEVMKKEHS